MPMPDAPYSAEVERVVQAATISAMEDFAALLLAYGRNGPITEAIIVHAREQVLMVLKNASATGMPLELQAIAFSQAVEAVSQLIDSSIRRGWASFQSQPHHPSL